MPLVTRPPAPTTSQALADLKAENSRLLREDIRERRTVFRALPEIVTLNSTDICNLRCVMCQRHVSQGKFRLSERVLEFVGETLFPTAKKVTLTTSGGEPLGAGFDTILDLARRHGVLIDVTTNGILMDERRIDSLLELTDHLNVSVDSPRAATYEKIRLGGEFHRLRENLEVLARRRVEQDSDMLFSISAVVMASNLEELPDLVDWAAELGAHGVLLQRLQHVIKATREEEPLARFAPERVEEILVATEERARERGVMLIATELGRGIVPAPGIRPKRPVPLDEEGGVCSFLTQTFTVMYTGEVYPCCKPTDYLLGDVHYDDPIEIWNNPRLQRLRAAHYDGTGTLFCNGCELASYLPEPRWKPSAQAVKSGRRAIAHVTNRIARERRRDRQLPIWDAPKPEHDLRAPVAEALPVTNGAAPRIQDLGRSLEAIAIDPVTSNLVVAADDALWFLDDARAQPRLIAALPADLGGYTACLRPLAGGALLLASESGGGLWRMDRSSGLAEQVLATADERSFFRTGAVVETPAGIFAGEYGVFPGARCARLWHSRDDGRSFELLHHFEGAHHMHCLLWNPGRENLMVTTGDFPQQRCTYELDCGSLRIERRLSGWSGFTAAATTPGWLHFGTDLFEGNGLVRWRQDLDGSPEFTPMPADRDLQLRQIHDLPDGRLVALAAVDEPVAERTSRKQGALLLSDDQGASWRFVHHFGGQGGPTPESFAVVPSERATLVTARTPASQVIELPPAAPRP